MRGLNAFDLSDHVHGLSQRFVKQDLDFHVLHALTVDDVQLIILPREETKSLDTDRAVSKKNTVIVLVPMPH